MKDYSIIINVKQKPEESFKAITYEMSEWWSKMTSKFEKIGDIASVSFNDGPAVWTFQAEELSVPHRVILKCIEAKHKVKSLPDTVWEEWKGTRLIFNIKESQNGSEIQFIHEGLNKNLLCHGVCTEGWNHFVGDSLRTYLNK